MTMNVDGEEEGSGILNINAENEGLDSELHLTINGGNINIRSGNDGINTNEDYVSVTTVNGGSITILVTGETGEGDGIDSNGWLVINGGKVIAAACANSQDAGIDSDLGIHINGGTVIASGHMLDHIAESKQNYAVFNFAQLQSGDAVLSLKNEADEEVMAYWPQNGCSVLIYSAPELTEGNYTLWSDGAQLSGSTAGGGGGIMQRPGGAMVPKDWEDIDFSKLPEIPQHPGGAEPPAGMEPPEGMERPDGDGRHPANFQMNEDGTVTLPDGTVIDPAQLTAHGGRPGGGMGDSFEGERNEVFTIVSGGNYFSFVAPME